MLNEFIQSVQSVDESILLWIQANVQNDFLTPFIKAFTDLGNTGKIWILLGLLLLIPKATRRYGFYTLTALFFSMVITNLTLKPMIDRPRPYVTIEELTPIVISGDPNSFPSGHTSAAFAAGITWLAMATSPWIKGIALLQAILMGLSRLYVCVHYPSDVLVGALAGTLAAVLAVVLLRTLEQKFKTNHPQTLQ